MVGRSIFEVTVLHHLGIQSAVGSITDVLEEDTDKFFADFLLSEYIDIELCLHLSVGNELGISLGVVGKRFAPLGIVGSLLVEVGLYGSESLTIVVDSEDITHIFLTTHNSLFPLSVGSSIFVGSGWHISREMTEIGVGSRLAILAVLGAINHIILSPTLCHNHRGNYSLMTHSRIILRSPCDEVATICHGKARRHIIHLEHSGISALVERNGIFGIHLLVGSPSGIVRLEDLSDVEKRCGGGIRGVCHMHTLVDGRRIQEDLVGSHRREHCDRKRR